MSRGLILSSDRHLVGLDDGTFQRAVKRGELVRIRRGAYCGASEWEALSSRERHLLMMRAVASSSSSTVVFCGYSAAALWGMPIPSDWPTQVHVISPPAVGGRSRNCVVRHPVAHTVDEVIERDQLFVTGITRTAIDMALGLPFRYAVGCVDWALSHRNELRTTVAKLRIDLRTRDPRCRRRHAEAVIDFATDLSDSYGESVARAAMHELGFPTPQLQVQFTDGKGHMVVDYFWPVQRVVGEFDGKSKYLRPEFRPELTAGEMVWREKKREDRLRRMVKGVVRIVAADVANPARLIALLEDAGLRRR